MLWRRRLSLLFMYLPHGFHCFMVTCSLPRNLCRRYSIHEKNLISERTTLPFINLRPQFAYTSCHAFGLATCTDFAPMQASSHVALTLPPLQIALSFCRFTWEPCPLLCSCRGRVRGAIMSSKVSCAALCPIQRMGEKSLTGKERE